MNLSTPFTALRHWLTGRNSPPAEGGLEARADRFWRLLPREAPVERLATGFRFTEGPVWIEEEGALRFSDIPASVIYTLSPEGAVAVFRQPSHKSNGLTRDPAGRLLACEHETRRLTRTEPDGALTVLADRYQDHRLNSPNDVVVAADGAVYFTDPPYGIRPEEQEQPVQGVYRLPPDGGPLALVADGFEAPNGLAFSPDGRTLYVDDSERRELRAFDVQADGSLTRERLFHDMNADEPGKPDGMKVDTEGHLYCTGAGGVWVFEPDGTHLGTIRTPERAANCAWGDDGRSLYITATSSVYRVRVRIPGRLPPAPPG